MSGVSGGSSYYTSYISRHPLALLDRKADQLSQTELFERIVYKIRRKYDFQISEMEAIAAARNLIGFTQTLLELSKHSGNVEP